MRNVQADTRMRDSIAEGGPEPPPGPGGRGLPCRSSSGCSLRWCCSRC
jgi:hypothetical protein